MAHLLEVRAALDRNIQMLQVRSVKRGDLSVHVTNLPKQTCFCRQYQCKDTSEAAANLRDTYIAAAKTGSMSLIDRMFTICMGNDPSALDLLCCIPLKDDYDKTPELGLAVNHSKESVAAPGEPWEFLGFSYHNSVIDLSENTIRKMKHKIRRKAHALRRWQQKRDCPPIRG